MSEHHTQNTPRDFRRRMRWAFAFAVILHAILLLIPVGFPGAGTLLLPSTPEQEPVVISLKQPDEPRRLVEPGAPAQQPVDPHTDLISEQASKAQDMTTTDTAGLVPDAGAVGPEDKLIPPPPAAPPTPAAAPAEPAEESAPQAKPKEQAPPKPKQTEKPKPAPADTIMAKVDEPATPLPKPEEKPQDAAMQLAKADTPPVPMPKDGKTQSRVEGGVKSKGFLSFEAMESDFAPYLRQVRDKVEKRWKALMHMRYSGVSTTQAVLDCAISPDGKISVVDIVEPGGSATYAGLCKEAIEQAGPFGPFPFQVPEMYKNQNIEIRWTFSFL